MYASEALSGQVDADSPELRSGPVIKFVNIKIPGASFGPGGKIVYQAENGTNTKFYEYSVHILSYVNAIKTDNPVATAAYAGGRVNVYTRRHWFKDA